MKTWRIPPLGRPNEVKTSDLLYFMRIEDGPVKIGRTNDLDARLAKIQTACPQEIDWAIGFPNCGAEEKEWHRRFADQRLRGEWFTWCPELDQAIKAKQRKVARQFK
jgi:hypothetical protein